MIIEKTNMSMSSSRAYKTETVSGFFSNLAGDTMGSMVSSSFSSLENNFKDILDDKEALESSEDSVNSKTSYDNGEMMLKGSRVADIRRQPGDSVSARRVREMTLLLLLQRIRRSLHRDLRGDNYNYEDYLSQSDSSSQGGSYSLDNSLGNLIKNIQAYKINDAGGLSAGNGKISRIDLYSHYEEENTQFETQGEVVTADGRRIGFNVSLSMSRAFKETYLNVTEVPFTVADLCDPLVINLNDNVASVSDQEFTLDIDCDGIIDTMNALNKGSGFIALDKNGDGKINDGSELFGTKSGDGFKDLAAYDSDGNGWIDEADEIFNKLLIWTKDENGKDILYHLKDKGIGAINLECMDTDFSLKDIKNGSTNAVIRKTGIFLYENGGIGTVQHLDLAT